MRSLFLASFCLLFLTACTKLYQPTDLKAVALNDSTVRLEWEDWSKGEDGYLIYETSPGQRPYATSRKPADTESGLLESRQPGVRYEYYVVAINGTKESPASQTVVVETPNFHPQPPAFLAAKTTSASEVELTWSDNNSHDMGFEIRRREGETNDWTTVAKVGSKVNTFIDRNLDPGKSYYYQVRAAGNGYFSDYCAETMAVTRPKTGIKVLYPNGGEVISGPELTIRYSAGSTYGGFKVYFYNEENYWLKIRDWATNDGVVLFNDFASLIPSKTYKVRIASSDPNIYDDSDGVFEVK